MLPKSVFKTCPKCEKVSERSSSRTLHSTLAYSKCRCHRMLQYRLEQYKAQALDTRKKKELVPKSTPLPHTSLHPTPSPPSPKLPHLHQAPNAPRKHNRACSQSQRTLCSPKHSFVTNTSPQASCRLPTIACPSVIHQPSLVLTKSSILSSSSRKSTKEPPPSAKKVSTLSNGSKKTCVARKVYKLVDLVVLIPKHKRRTIRTAFRNLDRDGDGHLTFDEYVSGIPGAMNRKFEAYFIQLYHSLNADTYFGCREFLLCSYMSEILMEQSDNILSHLRVSGNFIENFLVLYSGELFQMSLDGVVGMTDIKKALIEVHKTKGILTTLSTSQFMKLMKRTGPSFSTFHCIALAPFYINIPSPQ